MSKVIIRSDAMHSYLHAGESIRSPGCSCESDAKHLSTTPLAKVTLPVPTVQASAADRAHFIRAQFPPEGMFYELQWRVSPQPFALGPALAQELESLGRVLLQFYRTVNLLYRQSVAGKQPAWIAGWLDQGKPARLIEWQRSPALKNEVPRVIRPDLLLTENGLCLVELDSVPGGIGLTAWLNETYARAGANVIGGADGMVYGFASMFAQAPRVHIVLSDEAGTYRPEMLWLCQRLNQIPGPVSEPHRAAHPTPGSEGVHAPVGPGSDPPHIEPRFCVREVTHPDFADGDAVYRFFELFDLANVPNAAMIFDRAREKRLQLTPPPKPIFEEKMVFALLWNGNLREFWLRELGEGFLQRLQRLVPYSWMMDPSPLPPHAAIPELNLTHWQQLKTLSQRDRQLILKISGYSELAWGARGVHLGSDLSLADWGVAVDTALKSFEHSPYVLQRYHKPKIVQADWFDFQRNEPVPMPGRVRLCPYYFVTGEGNDARARLGGVLATVCPADKKIIHGMSGAVLAPCSI